MADAHHSHSLAEAQTLAEATAHAMWSRDQAARALGMALISVRPGHALLTMTVRSDMVNGHHICHGGMIFALADTAFAYACNSYNKNTVASACNIDFLAPGKEGEILEAEARWVVDPIDGTV
ncbi:MAG: hydroxyphenylacetyl-CoA thioesterase PaaI, partial [Burkholderiaceae bacterium]